MENGREHRVAIFLLNGEIIAHRILSGYRSPALNDTATKEHTFGKSGLAATRTAKQCNILDLVSLIYSHIQIDLSC